MQLKQKERLAGYDLEELYFEKLNRELIQKMKNKTSQQNVGDGEQNQLNNVIPFPKNMPQFKKRAA